MSNRFEPSYVYRAEILRVVDGDTFDARIDLGFHTQTVQRFRLNGIDTPEVRGEERTEGLISTYVVECILNRLDEAGATRKKLVERIGDGVAMEEVEALLQKAPLGGKVLLRSLKTGKFGRWLADVFIEVEGEQTNLTEWLIANGLGTAYHGGKR